MHESRPSNARIDQLREQNAALQARLQEQQLGPGRAQTLVHDIPPVNPSSIASSATQSDSEMRVDPSVRLASTSVDEGRTTFEGERNDPSDDQFHGPTSAMFDTKAHDNRIGRQPVTVPDDYLKGRLLSETVKQRKAINPPPLPPPPKTRRPRSALQYWNGEHGQRMNLD